MGATIRICPSRRGGAEIAEPGNFASAGSAPPRDSSFERGISFRSSFLGVCALPQSHAAPARAGPDRRGWSCRPRRRNNLLFSVCSATPCESPGEISHASAMVASHLKFPTQALGDILWIRSVSRASAATRWTTRKVDVAALAQPAAHEHPFGGQPCDGFVGLGGEAVFGIERCHTRGVNLAFRPQAKPEILGGLASDFGGVAAGFGAIRCAHHPSPPDAGMNGCN